MPSRRSTELAAGPPRRAFTLIELLISLAILILLSGMIVGVGFNYLEKVKYQTSIGQVEHVFTALQKTGAIEGSACASLQQACDLGGVVTFATLPEIYAQVRKNNGGDYGAANLQYNGDDPGGAGGRYFPPPIRNVADAKTEYYFNPVQLTTTDGELQGRTRQIWRSVVDVMPPATGAIPANYNGQTSTWGDRVAYIYDNWYVQQWPYVWPRTDWAETPPGSTPPILRFPWGSYGLRIDGQLVEPGRPATDIVGALGVAFIGQRGPTATHPRATSFVDHEGKINTHSMFKFIGVPNAWSVFGSLTHIDGVSVREHMSYSELSSSEQAAAVYQNRSDGSPATVAANAPEPFDVGLMSPLRSIEFLQAAGVLPAGEDGAAVYRSDRTPGKPWNDAWGHPLVIAYALFQPERYQCVGNDGVRREQVTTARRGMLLAASKEHFGYSRALYLVGGCLGPELAGSVTGIWDGQSAWDASDDAVILAALWKQICDLTKAHQWTEEVQAGRSAAKSSASGGHWVSDWSGSMRRGERGRLKCAISRVVTIK